MLRFRRCFSRTTCEPPSVVSAAPRSRRLSTRLPGVVLLMKALISDDEIHRSATAATERELQAPRSLRFPTDCKSFIRRHDGRIRIARVNLCKSLIHIELERIEATFLQGAEDG